MSDKSKPVPPVKSRHFPPPPPLVEKTPGLWRRTPPALFPAIMGLFGLGLAWRLLALQPGLLPLQPIGEAILGAVLLLYAFSLIAWLSKPLRRPKVVLDELNILPGRAGMVALTLSMVLAASALRPYAPELALVLVFLGMAALAVVGALITWKVGTGPKEGRGVTPVFHLTYVGYILAPQTLIPLGFEGLSRVIFWVTMVSAVLIWLASLAQFLRRNPPAPLRPLMAIHAAPAAVFAGVAVWLGYPLIGAGFALLALAFVAVFAASAKWLLVSGFSPLWGALTFPLAATASASVLALGQPGLWIGAVLLAFATGFNLFVAFQVFKSWAKGELGAKTNAAIA
ncbi:tellurium resistance protein [Pararhodobacter marinus]|uniref:SLAC1 family transporter n=1 Tax=Pararhodobacter marinus TaxID=2184063 RepID=UPI003516E7B3